MKEKIVKEKILIVEDQFVEADYLKMMLEKEDYTVSGIARSVGQAQEMIKKERPGFVLLDIFLKGKDTGIDLARQLFDENIPFVYLSANSNEDVLNAAKETQPYGFLVKPFRDYDLMVTLEIARYRHEQRALLTVNQPGRSATQKHPADIAGFQGIIGKSPAMLTIMDLVNQVAQSDTSVLILGESGTGKERIADCIHNLSPRKGKPFIKVSCAALPASLIESELFGHEKGTFTGANERHIGKFERAHGGTILLDEIGEMPIELQVKLLRVLQEREIERIGGKEAIKVDVRIIAATNRKLEKEVADGKFRLDLYYRLNVFPITLPPLRDRKEDIPALASHFLDVYCRKAGRKINNISEKVLGNMLSYDWPGNIRELEHLIERSVLLTKGAVIETMQLPATQKKEITNATAQDRMKTIHENERDHIIAVLKKCNGRIWGPGAAAEILNLPPSTLQSRMKKLGIKRKYLEE